MREAFALGGVGRHGVVGICMELWASRKMAAIFALWLGLGIARTSEGVVTRFLPTLDRACPGVVGSTAGASSRCETSPFSLVGAITGKIG